MNQEQATRMIEAEGFIAALDQSGGSTPKALRAYGIHDDAYSSDAEMFDLVHAMRSRLISSPSFTSDKVLAAILCEMTMDREVEGLPTAQYLWEKKGIVPLLKIDKGLADKENDVQIMKPMPDLDSLLDRGVNNGVFGTKERSVIHGANAEGIQAVVDQQFEVGKQVLAKGLVPILEPEVTISIEDKKEAEELLKAALLKGLDDIPEGQQVMIKISIPTVDNFYDDLINHPKVMRVVALSGGYERDDANERLSRNKGLIASFSRALLEGLTADQTQEEFDTTLATTIDGIYKASIAG